MLDTDPGQTIKDNLQEDNGTVVMIPADQPSTWTIHSLPPHSTVKLSLRAHNTKGFSEESLVIVETPSGNSQQKISPDIKTHISAIHAPASVLTLTQTSSSSSSLSQQSVITIFTFILIIMIFVDFGIFKTYHKGKHCSLKKKMSRVFILVCAD